MTSEHCSGKAGAEPAARTMAFLVGLWMLLNAIASAYVATHGSAVEVRQFLERLNAVNTPALRRKINNGSISAIRSGP
jgi:hypothetical protein